MATAPTEKKSANPYEAHHRRNDQARIEEALKDALAAEQSLSARLQQDRVSKELTDKLASAAKSAQEKSDKAQAAAESARGVAETTKHPRWTAEAEKKTAIAEKALAEANSAKEALGKVSPNLEDDPSGMRDKMIEGAARQGLNKDDLKKVDKGQEMAERIVEARQFLAEKHSSHAQREKDGTLELTNRIQMTERIKESDHSKLLLDKDLSYGERRELRAAINLDLDARTVEQKLDRRAEAFLDDKHPMYAAGDKAKPGAEDEKKREEPKVQVAKAEAQQPAKRAVTPTSSPSAKEAPEKVAEDKTQKPQVPNAYAKPEAAPAIPTVEVSSNGTTHVYNDPELKKVGPMFTQIESAPDGTLTYRHAGSKEEVEKAQAAHKEATQGPDVANTLSTAQTSDWHKGKPEKGWAPVEDRTPQAIVKEGVEVTPERTATANPTSLNALEGNAAQSPEVVITPVRLGGAAPQEISPAEALSTPVATAQAQPHDLGALDTKATPVATAQAQPYDLGSIDSKTPTPAPLQVAENTAQPRVETFDLPPLAANAPKEGSKESLEAIAKFEQQQKEVVAKLDAPAQAYQPKEAAPGSRIESYDLPPLAADAPKEGSKEAKEAFEKADRQERDIAAKLEATSSAYKAPDQQAVDGKLLQSAHPKEAELTGNVLGKEGPTAEATQRFDPATYERAAEFVKEQQADTTKAQEREPEQQQQQQREREREMEME